MNQPVMDRWTTVKRIHQSALDRDPSERAAFVNESGTYRKSRAAKSFRLRRQVCHS
jgi:hypothetical protein